MSFTDRIKLLEQAPDFCAINLGKGEANLSDYIGRQHVVLEFGSITCPYCVDVIPAMEYLNVEFSEFGFELVFVYTSEAHPGEYWPEHRSIEQKIDHAWAFKRLYGVKRDIWVDRFDEKAHKLYGSRPNMSWIIDKEGKVVFKANWTDPLAIRRAIQNLVQKERWIKANTDIAYFFAEEVQYRANKPEMYIKGLRRNGPQALLEVGAKLIQDKKQNHN